MSFLWGKREHLQRRLVFSASLDSSCPHEDGIDGRQRRHQVLHLWGRWDALLNEQRVLRGERRGNSEHAGCWQRTPTQETKCFVLWQPFISHRTEKHFVHKHQTPKCFKRRSPAPLSASVKNASEVFLPGSSRMLSGSWTSEYVEGNGRRLPTVLMTDTCWSTRDVMRWLSR